MERNVAEDRAAAAEMIRVSGQRGVPVIVIDGHVVVGFDRPALEKLLAGTAPAAGAGPAAPADPAASSGGGFTLGLSIADATAYGRKHGLQLPPGAYVGAVRPGSAGAKADLAAGDVITAVAGKPVRSDRELEAVLTELLGRRVPVVYWRNGQTRMTELAL